MAFKITIENTGNFIRDSIFISVFNVLGYVTPFVVYSSISQKFGTSDLGKYLYILAFHEFFNVLLDIGIMYTGAKEISESNEDKKRISTFRTVFFTKLLIYFIYIVLIAFSVLGEILFKIEILKYDNSFYFFGCFYLLGQLLLGEWFYKGNNKNKLFSILIFLDKLIFLSIFLLLFGKIGNVVVFFAIYSIVHLLIGVFSFLNISRNIRSFDIKFRDFLNWVRSGFFFQFEEN